VEPGDGSQSETNLVARINRKNRSLRADIAAYNRLQARKRNARRRYADDTAGTEDPDEVHPELSGTDDQGPNLRSPGESLALDSVETQPKDASIKVFQAFDRWLHQATGKTARQHGNPVFIRRMASRYAKGKGISLTAFFPTLEFVLREARKAEGRKAQMRRRADDNESLDVAEPDVGRIDVEDPVKNTTNADAQASQYDLGDFGNNAGDDIADPDLATDSQIWAPGEGEKTSRRANPIAAMRLARRLVEAGLEPPEDEWKLAAQFQLLTQAAVDDRIRLAERYATRDARRQARRVTAGNSRGTRSLPPGIGRGTTRAASTRRIAETDPRNDSALFFK
jgi:hypothetical protein